MLFAATAHGNEALARLAKEWGASNFELMLFAATANNHVALVCLAKEWGATRFNRMLVGAARAGHAELAKMAKDWGASNFDRMLAAATSAGRGELVRMAKEWGASDFDGMLGAAIGAGHGELAALAIEWGAKETADPRYKAIPSWGDLWSQVNGDMLIVVSLVDKKPGITHEQLGGLLREIKRPDEDEFYEHLVGGLQATLDAAVAQGCLTILPDASADPSAETERAA
jgi:hypothetical protein